MAVELGLPENGEERIKIKERILSYCEEVVGKDHLWSPWVADPDLGCEKLRVARVTDYFTEEDIGFRIEVKSYQLVRGWDRTFYIFYSDYSKKKSDFLEITKIKGRGIPREITGETKMMGRDDYVLVEQLLLSAPF